jgi:hypothetical protein
MSDQAQVYERRSTRALAFSAIAASMFFASIQLVILAAQSPRFYLSFWVSVPVLFFVLAFTTVAFELAGTEFYVLLRLEAAPDKNILIDPEGPHPMTVRLGLWAQRKSRRLLSDPKMRWSHLARWAWNGAILLPPAILWFFAIWAEVHGGLLRGL